MAPETAVRGTRKPRENQYIFDLGVKGRQVDLPLTLCIAKNPPGRLGLPCRILEYEMRMGWNLWMVSSLPLPNRLREAAEQTGYAQMGMQRFRVMIWTWVRVCQRAQNIDSHMLTFLKGTVPEPMAVLNERQSIRMPPPRSKSPIKTFLQSPARRYPSLGPTSSPLRGSIVAPKSVFVAASVRRKLDFSVEDLELNKLEESEINGSPRKRAAASKLTNGTIRPVLTPSALEYEGDDGEPMEVNTAAENEEDSFQIFNGDYDEGIEQNEEEAPVSEPETEPQSEPAKEAKGRPKGKGKEKAKEPNPEPQPEMEVELESVLEDEVEAEPESVKKPTAKGRGKSKKHHPRDAGTEEPPAKRKRHSIEGAELPSMPVAKAKSAKSQTTKAALVADKPVGKKSKLASISEAESPDIQRGPPLPRNNRGLFIMRRETPFEGTGFKQSRYGRNSIKPVAWWKNERVEYSEDEADDGTSKFLVSRIKEVVRNDEVEDSRPKKTSQKSSKRGKKRAVPDADEDDDEADAWESNPGRIINEVQQWDPYDEVGAEVAEEEQEVAWSSAAIITNDVPSASFKFAKCLSVPFFGAGIMDIPVGGMKKPKNSRKMQMVFFVYTGRVQVSINGGDPFRISHGGMWQVPRGELSQWICCTATDLCSKLLQHQ